MISQPAHAGFFSFLGDLLGINNEETEPTPINSQTISLLESTSNPNTGSATGGGDITIINNNAIMANPVPDSRPTSDQISIYVVRKGDTLSQIADMFDVSVNTIRWANNLGSGETIKTDQILIILPITSVQYTIKKGDTIKDIAKKFNADANEILQFNNLAINNKLTEGETIIIPNGDYTEPEQTTAPSQKPKIAVPSYIGYYLRPIADGRKSQGIHGYNAVDLADSCGTPIMASHSGDVIIAKNYGWNAGYGNYVVISHPNGTQTLYAHMSKTIVFPGWHVAQGQVIGYIGTTGHSTGCHVHFEIRGAKNPF